MAKMVILIKDAFGLKFLDFKYFIKQVFIQSYKF